MEKLIILEHIIFFKIFNNSNLIIKNSCIFNNNTAISIFNLKIILIFF